MSEKVLDDLLLIAGILIIIGIFCFYKEDQQQNHRIDNLNQQVQRIYDNNWRD